ncbi:hypothetical protein GT348_03785 [Aristophania vespae]|uniref:Transposase n=1 Tax=Aristophania vespae TaxID=2697033 RepID=A0A6P1NDF9_9PROT|nr:hypothetical protein [Aristophania vespae]QHI95503.1 hypothetical protein GT348_03785 [Aristophania vespae]
MKIENITYKGLKRFFTIGNAKGFLDDVTLIRLVLVNLQAASFRKILSAT